MRLLPLVLAALLVLATPAVARGPGQGEGPDDEEGCIIYLGEPTRPSIHGDCVPMVNQEGDPTQPSTMLPAPGDMDETEFSVTVIAPEIQLCELICVELEPGTHTVRFQASSGDQAHSLELILEVTS
ncbi:MAG: hypothetical protein R3185_08375 [Candidatus Thermoplasmatota archaeon]|nr:hypothetical protein [Candidatus Thermoplasmatota archaeon]